MALVDLWCDEAGAWAAMRVKNKANQGRREYMLRETETTISTRQLMYD